MRSENEGMAVRVLEGVRVVEIGGMGPGPFAGMVLADHGAEVVTLVRPGRVRRMYEGRTIFERGKRSEVADLKSGPGRARALELIADADVAVEGFRPGTAERLGLGPDDCRAANPRLVYARMTGWGQDGPLARHGGHDINYIGLAGYLHQVGRKGGPPVPPLNIVGDFGGGGLLLAFGIVAALLDARRTGRGRVVDTAMVDGVALMMGHYYMPGARLGPRGTNQFDSGVPFYDVYRTADGGYMAVGATGADLYARMTETLGVDVSDLPGQHDPAGWPELRERLTAAFATRTRAEWTEVFAAVDAAVTPVLDPYEALDHPHHRARGTFVDAGGHREPGPAPRFRELGPGREHA
ncbi:CaiB/BaiF CoA transferase family protein [Actinomadura rugatobispora]|uniref:CaiB/BaiF CoA transferase family protein n=1 Tax=Actinomadura rugatobispora TaxID=1994 RepID=A0ABW1A759_9ACTN